MTKLRMAALAILVTAAAAACGDDECSATDPDCSGTVRTLVLVSGNNQVGAVDAALPDPLVVRVEDSSGNPADGVSVTWALQSAAGAGATLSASSSTSGTDGQTSITFTLGDAAGAYEVRASIAGSTVTFTAEATTSGALQISTGNGQVGQSGARLAQPLVVKAVGAGGIAVPGIEVAFSVTESQGVGAAVDPAVATTNASGFAQTTLTLGAANGPVRVSASANGSTLQFSAYACGGDLGEPVLDLQPGAYAVISWPDVACVQLPAHADSAAYEVVVSPLPQALGFNVMRLAWTAGPAQGSGSARSFSAGMPEDGVAVEGPLSLQYQWDQRMRQLEQDLRPTISASASRGGFGLLSIPAVGEQRTIKFSCVGYGGDGTFPSAPEDLTVEAIVVSSKAVIWEDVQNPGAFTQAQYADIAATFDNIIYAVDTTYFGSPGDIDEDGRISLVYSSEINRMTDQLSGTYSEGFIAGFFCPRDLGFPGYNNAEMFFLVVPDPSGSYVGDNSSLSVDTVREQTDNTVAHEFQHMINAQNHPDPFGPEIWLNEGLSHLAEEVVGHAVAGFSPGSELGPEDLLSGGPAQDAFVKYYRSNFINLGIYLKAPGDTAALLNSRDPIEYEEGTFRMRGAAWIFLRYLLDRFSTSATEAQKTRQLIAVGTSDSRDDVESVFGVPFNDLVADWSAMLITEDRDDLGGVPDPSLLLSSYKLHALFEESFLFGFQYPLKPIPRALGTAGILDLDLFTATAEYVTLAGKAAAGGTGLRLMNSAGGDLAASIAPYMVIVRTK